MVCAAGGTTCDLHQMVVDGKLAYQQLLVNVGGGAAAASGEPGQDTTSTTIDVWTEYG